MFGVRIHPHHYAAVTSSTQLVRVCSFSDVSFNGGLDEFRLYNRAWSSNEALAAYQMNSFNTGSQLVYYKFDVSDSTDSTVHDWTTPPVGPYPATGLTSWQGLNGICGDVSFPPFIVTCNRYTTQTYIIDAVGTITIGVTTEVGILSATTIPFTTSTTLHSFLITAPSSGSNLTLSFAHSGTYSTMFASTSLITITVLPTALLNPVLLPHLYANELVTITLSLTSPVLSGNILVMNISSINSIVTSGSNLTFTNSDGTTGKPFTMQLPATGTIFDLTLGFNTLLTTPIELSHFSSLGWTPYTQAILPQQMISVICTPGQNGNLTIHSLVQCNFTLLAIPDSGALTITIQSTPTSTSTGTTYQPSTSLSFTTMTPQVMNITVGTVGTLNLSYTLTGPAAPQFITPTTQVYYIYGTNTLNITCTRSLVYFNQTSDCSIQPTQTFSGTLTIGLALTGTGAINTTTLTFTSTNSQAFRFTGGTTVEMDSITFSLSGTATMEFIQPSPSTIQVLAPVNISITGLPTNVYNHQLVSLSIVPSAAVTVGQELNTSVPSTTGTILSGGSLIFITSDGTTGKGFTFQVPTSGSSTDLTLTLSNTDALHYRPIGWTPGSIVITPQVGWNKTNITSSIPVGSTFQISIAPLVGPLLASVSVQCLVDSTYLTVSGPATWVTNSNTVQVFIFTTVAVGVTNIQYLVSGPDAPRYLSILNDTVNIIPSHTIILTCVTPTPYYTLQTLDCQITPGQPPAIQLDITLTVNGTGSLNQTIFSFTTASTQSFRYLTPSSPETIVLSVTYSGPSAADFTPVPNRQWVINARAPFVIVGAPTPWYTNQVASLQIHPSEAVNTGLGISFSVAPLNGTLVGSIFPVTYHTTDGVTPLTFQVRAPFTVGTLILTLTLTGPDVNHYQLTNTTYTLAAQSTFVVSNPTSPIIAQSPFQITITPTSAPISNVIITVIYSSNGVTVNSTILNFGMSVTPLSATFTPVLSGSLDTIDFVITGPGQAQFSNITQITFHPQSTQPLILTCSNSSSMVYFNETIDCNIAHSHSFTGNLNITLVLIGGLDQLNVISLILTNVTSSSVGFEFLVGQVAGVSQIQFLLSNSAAYQFQSLPSLVFTTMPPQPLIVGGLPTNWYQNEPIILLVHPSQPVRPGQSIQLSISCVNGTIQSGSVLTFLPSDGLTDQSFTIVSSNTTANLSISISVTGNDRLHYFNYDNSITILPQELIMIACGASQAYYLMPIPCTITPAHIPSTSVGLQLSVIPSIMGSLNTTSFTWTTSTVVMTQVFQFTPGSVSGLVAINFVLSGPSMYQFVSPSNLNFTIIPSVPFTLTNVPTIWYQNETITLQLIPTEPPLPLTSIILTLTSISGGGTITTGSTMTFTSSGVQSQNVTIIAPLTGNLVGFDLTLAGSDVFHYNTNGFAPWSFPVTTLSTLTLVPPLPTSLIINQTYSFSLQASTPPTADLSITINVNGAGCVIQNSTNTLTIPAGVLTLVSNSMLGVNCTLSSSLSGASVVQFAPLSSVTLTTVAPLPCSAPSSNSGTPCAGNAICLNQPSSVYGTTYTCQCPSGCTGSTCRLSATLITSLTGSSNVSVCDRVVLIGSVEGLGSSINYGVMFGLQSVMREGVEQLDGAKASVQGYEFDSFGRITFPLNQSIVTLSGIFSTNSMQLTLNASELMVGGDYMFWFQVNSSGGLSPVSFHTIHSIQPDSNSWLPQLLINQPLTIKRNIPNSFSSTIIKSTCVTLPTDSIFVYSWTIYHMDEPTGSSSTNPIFVAISPTPIIPPYTFLANSTYLVHLDLSITSASGAFGRRRLLASTGTGVSGERTAESVFFVSQSNVVPIIVGSDRERPVDTNIVIDGSPSFDPDFIPTALNPTGLLFQWSCLQVGAASACNIPNSNARYLFST